MSEAFHPMFKVVLKKQIGPLGNSIYSDISCSKNCNPAAQKKIIPFPHFTNYKSILSSVFFTNLSIPAIVIISWNQVHIVRALIFKMVLNSKFLAICFLSLKNCMNILKKQSFIEKIYQKLWQAEKKIITVLHSTDCRSHDPLSIVNFSFSFIFFYFVYDIITNYNLWN